MWQTKLTSKDFQQDTGGFSHIAFTPCKCSKFSHLHHKLQMSTWLEEHYCQPFRSSVYYLPFWMRLEPMWNRSVQNGSRSFHSHSLHHHSAEWTHMLVKHDWIPAWRCQRHFSSLWKRLCQIPSTSIGFLHHLIRSRMKSGIEVLIESNFSPETFLITFVNDTTWEKLCHSVFLAKGDCSRAAIPTKSRLPLY